MWYRKIVLVEFNKKILRVGRSMIYLHKRTNEQKVIEKERKKNRKNLRKRKRETIVGV